MPATIQQTRSLECLSTVLVPLAKSVAFGSF